MGAASGKRKLSRLEWLTVSGKLHAAAKREAMERGQRCPFCDRQGTWHEGVRAVICTTCSSEETGEAVTVSRRRIPRAAVCGQKGIALDGGVKLRVVGRRKDGSTRATVSGVYHCNKPWQCPKCAARTAAGDARTLQACNLGWRGFVPDPKHPGRWVRYRVKAAGRVSAAARAERDRRAKRAAYLLTLTIPHNRGQSLEPLRRAVTLAYSRMEETPDYRRCDEKRPGFKQRFGIAASVRRLEVTDGPDGWHPHIHAILFVDRKLTDQQKESMREWYFVHWARAVEKLGYKRPTKAAGVDLCEADQGGQYLAKMGLREIAGDATKVGRCAKCGDYKGAKWEGLRRRCVDCGHELNRTPWQILWDLAEHGAEHDRRRWRLFVHEIAGARRLTWSRDRAVGGQSIREAYAEYVRVPEQARCTCSGLDPSCKRCAGKGRYERRRLKRIPFQPEIYMGGREELPIPVEIWNLRFSRDPQGLAELLTAYEQGDKHALEALLGAWMPPAKLAPDPDEEAPVRPTDDAIDGRAPHMGLVLSLDELGELREARGDPSASRT